MKQALHIFWWYSNPRKQKVIGALLVKANSESTKYLFQSALYQYKKYKVYGNHFHPYSIGETQSPNSEYKLYVFA